MHSEVITGHVGRYSLRWCYHVNLTAVDEQVWRYIFRLCTIELRNELQWHDKARLEMYQKATIKLRLEEYLHAVGGRPAWYLESIDHSVTTQCSESDKVTSPFSHHEMCKGDMRLDAG
jgi:hypothetical protein